MSAVKPLPRRDLSKEKGSYSYSLRMLSHKRGCYTQAQAARDMGVSPSTVSRWVRNKGFGGLAWLARREKRLLG